MTETLPTTGSRGQRLKIAQYLAEGQRLAEVVAARRVAKGEAGAEEPTETKPKRRKSNPLPPADGPTPIDGYPFNASPPKEAPDYGNIARVKATRATQAARRSKRAPMQPSGPSELRKASQ